jgi:outer membrane lipoprotein-sorting protein
MGVRSNEVKLTRLIAAGVMLMLGATGALAQTADEIVEKHLAAIGGREAIGRVRTRVSTGTVTVTTPLGELAGTVESFAKAPNKSRTLVKIDLTAFGADQLINDQRFDGNSAYVIDSLNGNRDITGTQLEAMKNNGFPTALLDYRARGHAIALIGKEPAAGRPAFVLEITPKTGPRARTWIDVESYLVVKTSVRIDAPSVGVVEQTTEFNDYRTVDGVKVAFSVKSSNAMQTVTATLTDVKHNVEVDDTSFAKP